MIGLSGLITPSLDEMVTVAEEMKRQGFKLPLLIGGATTVEGAHRAPDRAALRGPAVHVLDASRAVGVARRWSPNRAPRRATSRPRRGRI